MSSLRRFYAHILYIPCSPLHHSIKEAFNNMRKFIVTVVPLLVLITASFAQAPPESAPESVAAEAPAIVADSAATAPAAPAVEPDADAEPPRSYRLAVNFEADSLEPTPLSSAALDSMSAVFAKHTRNRYEVHGYTCPAAAGQKKTARLSAQRVERIVDYLMELGVPGENIVTIVNAPKTAVKEGCADDRLVDIISAGARWREPEPAKPEPPKAPEPEPGIADSLKAEMMELRRKLAEAERPEPRIAAPAPAPAAPEPPKPAVAEEGKQAVAVYMAGQEPPNAKGVHTIMGGELARVLSESDKYAAVDRTEAILEQLDREHVYQRSGAVDDDQIKAIGHQLGVGYLCISNINAVGRKYYLDTRLVDVVTAEIKRSVTATSGLRDAMEMSRVGREIALELLENEKTLRQRKLRKTIFRGTAIGLDVLGAAVFAYGYFENNNVVKQIGNDNGPEATRAATRRNAAYIVSAALVASGVTIHIVF
jgi:hypothetical protein